MKKWLLKLFANRTPKNFPSDFVPTSVLFRPLGEAIGDGLVLTGVFYEIRQRFPSCRIGVLTDKRNELVFKNNPLVDAALPNTRRTYLTQRNQWQVLLDYRPTFTTRSIVFDWVLNPAYTICFQKSPKKYYSAQTVHNYDFYAQPLCKYHLSRSLNLTPLRGDFPSTHYTMPPVPANDVAAIQPFLKADKINFLLCPFGTNRQVDPTQFQQIVNALPAEKIHFIAAFEPARYPLPPSVTYTGKLSLPHFLALVSKADFILSVDSAPVHLACAYGRPAIGLYDGRADNLTLFAPLPPNEAFCSTNKSPIAQPNIHQLPTEDIVRAIKRRLSL